MTIGLLLDDTLDRDDGVQQAVVSIGRELTKRGHVVHYIVPQTTRKDIKNIHSIGRYIQLKFNGNSVRTPLPISKKSIRKLYSEVNFDILHVQMPFSPYLSGKIIKYAPKNVKIFGTFHILPFNNVSVIGTKILGLISKKITKKFYSVFAVSEPANKFMADTYNIQGNVIPNPVDYDYFHSYKRDSKIKSIVFVGRFEQRKGVLQLVKAYSNLEKNILEDWSLTMCGKGPLLDESKELASNLKLAINFPGYVTDDEKAQYLANADIAVFPSSSGESFGIVLAEAMAAGSGVTIAGNNPGYSSVMNDFSAVLFDPININEFSDKLRSFINDDKLRKSVGIKQHEYVKQFDIKKVVDRLEKFYVKR